MHEIGWSDKSTHPEDPGDRQVISSGLFFKIDLGRPSPRPSPLPLPLELFGASEGVSKSSF